MSSFLRSQVAVYFVLFAFANVTYGQTSQQNPPPPPPPHCDAIRGEDALRDVHFRAQQPGVCLLGIDRWGDSDRGNWGREHRRGDGRSVDFDVEPNCAGFNVCASTLYSLPPRPSNAGSRKVQIDDAQVGFSSWAGQQYKATIRNPENLITTAYTLVNQPQVTCVRPGQMNAILVNSDGRGTYVEREQDCSEKRIEARLDRSMPGFYLDTLVPQIWQENDITQLQNTYLTDITVNVLPVDFPDSYALNGTIYHSQGQPAQVSVSSKYFVHSSQVVSQNQDSSFHGTQVINLVSTLRPIAAPSDISVDYDGRGLLTIKDANIPELVHIDPSNKASYNVAAYVNWNKTFGHEKFGNVLANSPLAVVPNSNQSQVQLNISNELNANPKFKEQLAGGGKDWAIYVEITANRTNKYVGANPSATVVYEITVGKKFVVKPGSIVPWNDPTKYR